MGYRNGLYYESMGIRNHVLERNIGKYRGYKRSLLENGGLAIGMPYAVETEFVPYTLSERAAEGIHLNLAFTKEANPKISVALREGGLFGYTHEVINSDFDWLSRNLNINRSYYDYQSTEDNNARMMKIYSTLPWGEQGLRRYSKFDDPQNANYFDVYTEYIDDIFVDGLSFHKSLGETYLTGLLYDGFSKEKVDDSVTRFIDEKAGYITDNIDELKGIADTKLGYIGKIMLDEAALKQIGAMKDRRWSGYEYEYDYIHTPITDDGDLNLGLETGNENDYMMGVSAFNEPKIAYRKFMIDQNDALEDTLDFAHENFQQDLLRKHLRKNRYKNFSTGGDGSNKDVYADYYNVTYFNVAYHVDDEEFQGVEHKNTQNLLGESVEGNFRGAGVYDADVAKDEHYDEHDVLGNNERNILSTKISYNQVENIGILSQEGFSSGENSLLSKTKQLFKQHKIKTLIGRFHTSEDDKGTKTPSLTQSALNETYGLSHGRNLLKLRKTVENGYENPYCRVWTYHHQYAKMTDLIRPFTDGENFMSIDAIQAAYPGRPILFNGGREDWGKKTVLNKNGMVNIAPTKRIGRSEKDKIKAKQCMFSIENLAWRGVKKDDSIIDKGEIGPLGGRIMWFPPYNLSFNESANVSWGSNDFIGRGERIYSYTNTERTGSLSFTILADHPSILNYWLNSDNRRDKPGSKEDQDTVLRFFAGCDNLSASTRMMTDIENGISHNVYAEKENQKNEPKDPQDKTDPEPENNIEEEIVPGPPDEFTAENSIGFYVFYPNNLSCIDFVDNPKVGVNYLVNGSNGFEFDPKLEGDEHISYDEQGNGTAMLDTAAATVGKWAQDIFMRTAGPGYEMGPVSGPGLTDATASADVDSHDVNGSPADKGRDYIWGYGIDQKYVKQRLCGPNSKKTIVLPDGTKKTLGNGKFILYPENYKDITNFKLNNEPNREDEACGYSFMDVAEALTPSPSAGGYNYNGKSASPERVSKIRKILGIDGNQVKNAGGRKFYFAVAGGASVHGYADLNDELSKNRASFLEAWLKYCFAANNLTVDQDMNAKIPYVLSVSGGEDDLIVNSQSAKRGRFAKAVIYWNDEDVKDATDAEKPYEEGATTDDILIQETAVEEDADKNITEEEAAASTTYQNAVTLHNYASTRYRDEEEFFDLLKESSPVIYKNIVDKVKYFDPVYHSITPEGFNSRLSFLHQCTRQGPTMSSSDLSQNNGFNGAGYAGNLAFGRAPVCVLRLGDFYNTRIVINSINIQYETAQWDLNPEGIGVQPMLANVTLSFVFQGGSSLGGPIQRLQNAVSFNYYANQEVYDDRADVAVYNEDKHELDEEASYIWMPGYGNVNLGQVSTATKLLSSPNAVAVEQMNHAQYLNASEQQKRDAEKAKAVLESNPIQSTEGNENNG